MQETLIKRLYHAVQHFGTKPYARWGVYAPQGTVLYRSLLRYGTTGTKTRRAVSPLGETETETETAGGIQKGDQGGGETETTCGIQKGVRGVFGVKPLFPLRRFGGPGGWRQAAFSALLRLRLCGAALSCGPA
jgi:hypothetical protein